MAPLRHLWRDDSGSNAALALAYADRGVRVFPCRPDRFGPSADFPKGDTEAKSPCPRVMWQGPEPGRRASIVRWWQERPGALIGVGLGERNLVVIDVDGGAEGVATWEDYCGGFAVPLDGVPVVATPTGGRHYFFRLPDGVTHGNARGGLPSKAVLPVDVRGGKSGYVIAAGTKRPYWGSYEAGDGNPFAWLDAPLIPATLLTILQGEKQHDHSAQPRLPTAISAPVGIENRRVRAWVDQAFTNEVAGVATCGEGSRNEQLNRAAFALGQFIPHLLTEGEVRGALEQAARDCGLWRDDGPAQCRKTISSGLRGGMKNLRQIPADILAEEEEAAEGLEVVRAIARTHDDELYDPETGEFVGNGGENVIAFPRRGKAVLPIVSAADFNGQPIPPRRWHVEDLVPAGTVTMLGGDGGTGKSLLALQLAVSTAIGVPWIGHDVEYGPALFLTAEDDIDEVHRRLADIVRATPITFDRLGALSICSLAGLDALLAVQAGRKSVITATALYAALKARISERQPILVVLDTLADLFGGEENDRAQARQFVSLLRALAIECGTTIVLLAHPSLSGMATGSGTSGSTAWNNSVRSRLYLSRPTGADGISDPDRRVLQSMKANYGRIGGVIDLRWKEGVFVRENGPATAGGDPPGKRAEQVFLDLLRAYERRGRRVSEFPGANYAPTIFAREADAQGLNKGILRGAMNRLFEAGTIKVLVDGSRSRPTRRIVIAVDFPDYDSEMPDDSTEPDDR